MQNQLNKIVEELKLIRILYGNDSGLVSLTTGLLLAHKEERTIHVAEGITTITVDDADATEKFGEEHNWNDIIQWLQKEFDWTTKSMPDPKNTCCANCKYFGDLKGTAGIILSNICMAPAMIDGKPFVYGTTPNSECELFTRKTV